MHRGVASKQARIHMNGRLEDPAVGRMLSVDPMYQAPTNSQSVNPYSYVMNNPMSLVDPSGYAAAASPLESTENESDGGPKATSIETVTLSDKDKVALMPDGHVIATLADGTQIDVTSMTSVSGGTNTSLTVGSTGWISSSTTGSGTTSSGTGTNVLKGDGAPGQAATTAPNQSGQTQTQAKPPSFTDAFNEEAANLFKPLTAAADRAVDYWAQDNSLTGKVLGTLAATVDSNNIGNTVTQVSVGVLTGAAGGLARAAKGGEVLANEGIYEFTAYNGKTYVGQSGSIAARIEQHLQSGKLLRQDLHTVRTTEVLGGKLIREIAEQLRINELGGVENLENVRNPIGPARAFLLPP